MSAQRHLRFALGLSTVLLALPAAADTDSKTFPGAFCRPVSGTGGQFVNHLVDDDGDEDTPDDPDGSIFNASTTRALDVICPILRDNTQTTDWFEVRVRFVLGFVGADPKCFLSPRGLFGGGQRRPSERGEEIGEQLITVPHQVPDGYSSLECTLPAAKVVDDVPQVVRLVMYRTLEIDTGTTKTDSKTFSGSFVESDADGDAFTGYDSANQAIVAAVTRDPRWVIPLVRDSVTEPWDRVRLRAFDDDDENDFSCSLTSYNENGTFADPVPGEQDKPRGNVTIEFPPPSDGVGSATHVATCSVPRKRGTVLFMYDIREK